MFQSLNLNLASIISSAVALLLGLTVHEFAHAWAADRLGDPTPRLHGRVTLNPLAHLDPIGTIMLVLTMIGLAPIGWGKPVPINPYYMRGGRRGAALATAAGPASNLVLALILAVGTRLAWTAAPQGMLQALSTSEGLYSLLFKFVALNVALAVFNLIPVPPLDGFGILEGIAPPSWGQALAILRQYGAWILLFLLIGGFGGISLLGMVFGPLYNLLVTPLLRLAGLI